MTVEEAHEFFKPVPVVARKLQTLLDVGLGYIRLGQSATTLSGGEAQRVKLSLELSQARHRPHALHPRRADHRPALPRHRAAAESAAPPARPGQHGRGHRAQPRRDQDRRLDHRPGSGRRRRRRRRSSRRARRSRCAKSNGKLYRQISGAAAETGCRQKVTLHNTGWRRKSHGQAESRRARTGKCRTYAHARSG